MELVPDQFGSSSHSEYSLRATHASESGSKNIALTIFVKSKLRVAVGDQSSIFLDCHRPPPPPPPAAVVAAAVALALAIHFVLNFAPGGGLTLALNFE